ncbi:MAG: DNA repair protein RecO [Clostridia bacterium]
MEEKLNALCVRTVDYKDNDRLITLCTVEKGKILAKATGCKTPKAKLKYAASPLCFGEYDLLESNGRYILKGCECYDNFSALSNDLIRYYAGFSVLECLDKLAKENDFETCRDLTLQGTYTLKELAYTDNSPYKTMVDFFIKILKIIGYELNFSACAVSGKSLKNQRVCFDYTYSGIVLFEYRSTDYVELRPDTLELLTGSETSDENLIKQVLSLLDDVLSKTSAISKGYSILQMLSL